MKPTTVSFPRSIACFITPHGLGHAARTAAILTALQKRDPGLRLEMFTMAPPSFFLSSGCRQATFHTERTDIGFAQKSALLEDVPETQRLLDDFLPFRASLVDRLSETVRQARCVAVLSAAEPVLSKPPSFMSRRTGMTQSALP